MGKTQLILLSVREHIESALTTAGWSNADKWVIMGHVEPESSPPVVAVSCPDDRDSSFETGNSSRIGSYSIDIEVYAAEDNVLIDLKDSVKESLNGIKIINFNTAMPGDDGYDADAQTVAYAHIGESVRARIVDPIENAARVSFVLRPDRIF